MRKLLLGLIGLLFVVPAVATDLPAGYTELEYIESTGTQYIDTGIYLASNMVVVVKAEQTGTSGNIFGYTKGDSGRWMFSLNTTASTASLYSDNTKAVGSFSSMPVEITCNMGTGITVNGITTNFTESATRTAPDTAWLFKAQGSSMTPSGRIYYFKIYQNNNLIMNLVPAKNSSGVVGMYDTVSGTFFTNAGTGEFIASPEVSIRIATTAYNSARFSPVVTELNDTIATIRSVVTNTINQTKAIADLQATKQTRPNENCPAGKKCLLVEDDAGQPHWYEIIESASILPDGFTELEYIKKNSLAYIDSGISQTDSVGVSIDIKFDSYNTGTYYQYALGAYNAGDYIGIWKANNSTVSLCFVSSIATVSSSDNTNFHNFKINYLNSRKFSYDDSNVRDIDQTKSATSPSIYIGDTNYSQHFGNSSFSIKRVRISNETDIVFDGIPAKTTINGTEVVGLYDTVSETFKTATSGTFIAGPEVQ